VLPFGTTILTGIVDITGSPTMGSTLTADTSGLNGSGALSYEWKRGAVSLGTASTYVVPAADKGSVITLTVTRAGYTGQATDTIGIPYTVIFNKNNTDSGSTDSVPTSMRVTPIAGYCGL
jgi:hypothetical protein